MRRSAYPTTGESATAFFEEAVRHLTDAHILIRSSRYPGSVASAHKAQELAIKAALIQENAMGIYEKMFSTHKPLSSVTNIEPLKNLTGRLASIRNGLVTDVTAFEALEPTKNSLNAEYPFHSVGDAGIPVVWKSPVEHFSQELANEYYNLAREVVNAISTLYAPDLRPGTEPIPDAAL